MKKITTIIVAILMLITISVNTIAAETQSTEISMTIDPSMESYTLTIPATIQIDPNVKTGDINVELSDVNLFWNTFLTVYATSQNHIDGEHGSYLIETTDNTKKISYSVLSECNGSNSFETSDKGIYAAMYNAAHEYRGSTYEESIKDGKITITVDGNIPGSGTYTDTLTFSVELQTTSDMYDRTDRDVTVDETRNLIILVAKECDLIINEGKYKVVQDDSYVNKGELYVLDSELEELEGRYASANTRLNMIAEDYEETGLLNQEELNDTYYQLATAWETFCSTQIYIKN